MTVVFHSMDVCICCYVFLIYNFLLNGGTIDQMIEVCLLLLGSHRIYSALRPLHEDCIT
jgi:hypothetical protein